MIKIILLCVLLPVSCLCQTARFEIPFSMVLDAKPEQKSAILIKYALLKKGLHWNKYKSRLLMRFRQAGKAAKKSKSGMELILFEHFRYNDSLVYIAMHRSRPANPMANYWMAAFFDTKGNLISFFRKRGPFSVEDVKLDVTDGKPKIFMRKKKDGKPPVSGHLKILKIDNIFNLVPIRPKQNNK